MHTRKIPATMVTQHPDHAARPYWHNRAFISSQFEAEEAYQSYAELGATEYKWDWEGKLVDESVVDRLFTLHLDYFTEHPLGEEKFLTFRLPNPRIQTEFRLARAYINMAIAASVAKHIGFRVPPIFEVILPFTENAEEMLDLQEAFVQIHALKHPLYKLDGFLTNLRVIPLFEKVETIVASDSILEKYLELHQKRFKKRPPYMRPYMARSDPALNSGIVPTVLAIKIALSRYKALSKKVGIPLHPILGAGSTPFRGGLSPIRVEDFVKEYPGVHTTTIQSAFRYDYPLDLVKKGIAYLEKNLQKSVAKEIGPEEEQELLLLIKEGQREYKQLIEPIADVINTVAASIPRRRERFQHVGLFGYSRAEGGVKLPRAISFACSLYSLGVPPEFIGTGKTIRYAIQNKKLPLLEKHYINLKKDLTEAGRFLNKQNLASLTKTSESWREIEENVHAAEEYLGVTFKPSREEEIKHNEITSTILKGLGKSKRLPRLIEQAALLRKNMG